MARRSDPPVRPLTRKAFYDLTVYCRSYAADLARFDQNRVNLKQCHRFNGWLTELRQYDKLHDALLTLAPARPIARWQLVVLCLIIWLILGLALPGRADRGLEIALLVGGAGTVLVLFFLPESLYGTTMELLDGKVLRVVDTLLTMLDTGGMDFSEAVYFQAKANLMAAHEELRQQIDLAHR